MTIFIFVTLAVFCLASGVRGEVAERRRLARMARECKERGI